MKFGRFLSSVTIAKRYSIALSTTKIGNIPGCEKYWDHLRSYREFTRREHTPEMRRRVGNEKPRLLNLGYHWGGADCARKGCFHSICRT